MVDKRESTPLQVKRGGRYLELNRSSPCKRKLCGLSNAAPYKGVRMRVWGKWVTEVRDPVTKTRIWLGSFATAEMAARAYDAAVVCLKGPFAPEVNFPDSIPSFVIPQCNSSPKQIQAVALAAATASVPAAAPLAMAATPEPPQVSESEMPHSDETAEISGSSEFHDSGEISWSSSNVESWINNELDAFDDPKPLVEPLRRQISDSVEQAFLPWPVTSDDYEDPFDCWMNRHDVELWSFA